ncbi:hypothetical protein JTE90_020484 [Oedothorax gibbosus]|uniref:Uncharacterized protein n=1 Tax=Oedothorax gibbosus TaxID=931172 RepID=A0AAV6UTB3_9ARAC|nr:hypothetical protein JTE90_020484 [Oedothorax gibbosus]
MPGESVGGEKDSRCCLAGISSDRKLTGPTTEGEQKLEDDEEKTTYPFLLAFFPTLKQSREGWHQLLPLIARFSPTGSGNDNYASIPFPVLSFLVWQQRGPYCCLIVCSTLGENKRTRDKTFYLSAIKEESVFGNGKEMGRGQKNEKMPLIWCKE